MPDSIQESSALSEILNRLKAMEAKFDKHSEEVGHEFKLAAADRQAIRKEMADRFKEVDNRFNDVDARFNEVDNRFKALDTKNDKQAETVGYQFKLAAADSQAIQREMDKRFKEVDKRFDSVASASGMREGFMAAAADREAIRLEMREGFRTAAERHETFKSKTEENNAEIIRIIADVGTMTYNRIDTNHQEVKVFQKSTIEALESINQSLKRFAHLESEIEELKKDKALKDATIKRMEQRLTKLEAQVNPA